MARLLAAPALRHVWPHVVAAFVALHVLACVLDALPNPSAGADRRNWREPRVQLEMEAWAKRLHIDKGVLEEGLWQLTTGWMAVRKTILAPVRPYLDATGIRQNWSMFVAGSRYRDRFQMRGRTCPERDERCDWHVLYARGEHEADFLREHLEHPRLRSGIFRWVWADHTKRYHRSCALLARRAFASNDALETVQCRFERSLAPVPRADAPPSPPPTWERVFSVTRADAHVGNKL